MDSLGRGEYTWGSTYITRSPLMNGDNSSPPIRSLVNIIFDLRFRCLKPRRKYYMIGNSGWQIFYKNCF